MIDQINNAWERALLNGNSDDSTLLHSCWLKKRIWGTRIEVDVIIGVKQKCIFRKVVQEIEGQYMSTWDFSSAFEKRFMSVIEIELLN